MVENLGPTFRPDKNAEHSQKLAKKKPVPPEERPKKKAPSEGNGAKMEKRRGKAGNPIKKGQGET